MTEINAIRDNEVTESESSSFQGSQCPTRTNHSSICKDPNPASAPDPHTIDRFGLIL